MGNVITTLHVLFFNSTARLSAGAPPAGGPDSSGKFLSPDDIDLDEAARMIMDPKRAKMNQDLFTCQNEVSELSARLAETEKLLKAPRKELFDRAPALYERLRCTPSEADKHAGLIYSLGAGSLISVIAIQFMPALGLTGGPAALVFAAALGITALAANGYMKTRLNKRLVENTEMRMRDELSSTQIQLKTHLWTARERLEAQEKLNREYDEREMKQREKTGKRHQEESKTVIEDDSDYVVIDGIRLDKN